MGEGERSGGGWWWGAPARDLEIELGRALWLELEGRAPAAVPRDRPLELPARLRRCRPARAPRPHRPCGGMGSKGRRDGAQAAWGMGRRGRRRAPGEGGPLPEMREEGGMEAAVVLEVAELDRWRADPSPSSGGSRRPVRRQRELLPLLFPCSGGSEPELRQIRAQAPAGVHHQARRRSTVADQRRRRRRRARGGGGGGPEEEATEED